jgi:hypothetical protein
MKKLFIVALMVLALAFAGQSWATDDQLMSGTLKRVDLGVGSNGADYVRLILPVERSLNGMSYEDEIVIMAFGTTVADAKTLQAGDEFKAICKVGEYKGNPSYRVLKIIQ